MRPFVELYINDQKVYFKEPPEIFITYAHTDLHNPTVVKNSFSKTITVEGTPENNRIFNNFYDMQRVNNGDLFNPSRKETFTLYRNGEPMETGYVKLDKVNKKNGRITYDISIFGGLGQFLYNLQYKEDGEEMKLSDLEYNIDFNFEVDRYTIKDAWGHLTNPNPNVISSPYDIINFAPCYNGIPENFAADKVAIYAEDIDVDLGLEEEKDGYGLVNGWMLGELEKEYDEWQTKDFRSYLQRPVIRFKDIIQACCKPENNGGFKVDLDSDFFNSENPYYENAWMTLPLISEMTSDVNVDETTINVNVEGNNIFKLDGIPDGTKINFTITLSIGSQVDSTVEKLGTFEPVVIVGDMGFWVSLPTNHTRYYQIVAYDKNDNIVGGSGVMSFFTSSDMTKFEYNPEYNTTVTEVSGYYYKQKDNSYIFNSAGYDFSIKNLEYRDGMYFKIIEKTAVFSMGGLEVNTNMLFDIVDGKDSWDAYAVTNYFNDIASYVKNVSVKDSVKKLNKQRILNSENTPCDYFLSYLKMFNLHIWKDMYEDLIYVRQRKNFFDSEVKDIEEFIDRGDTITIKPLTFENKWLNFLAEYEQDEKLHKDYKDNYGLEYGIQKIDTNYSFDSSSKDILENYVFKGCITSRNKSKYYVDVYNKQNDLRSIPPCFIDGCQTLLFNNENDTTEGTYITPKTSALSVNWWEEKYYDIFPKPSFVDKDNKSIDGANVLLFFNGVAEMDDINGKWVGFQITDDIPQFEKLNDGEPCWIYMATNYTDVAIPIGRLPMFSRYITNENGWVTHSWDFGTPKALYIPDYNIDDTSNIYNQYWKPYIRDQYDSNTRVVECKVLLKERVIGDWLQRFYYWDGRYWILNKITDYNPSSNGTTKCEFVSVNDINNYLS